MRRWIGLFALFAAAALVANSLSRAEEGMWTFDNPPAKQLMERYGFTPTPQWLDHVRLSSVRLNDGGSGSFVSPDGLLLTNHHVARGQLQKNSTAEHDYLQTGFYAATPDQEMKSPDLEVNVLVAMRNVTDRVQAAVSGITDEKQALKVRESTIALIEKEGLQKTGLRSDVVSLYAGGEYWLYQYKKYTDVRLVFAPEEQAAFFGGDPDNFTYPRYDLDMALFRVYENGKPIHSADYLKWSPRGAADGELIFISGNPGSTSRQQTMAQLTTERDYYEPAILNLLRSRQAALDRYSALGAEQSREVASTIFFLQNSIKAFQGRSEALQDENVIAKKQSEEDDFRQRVDANPEWKKEYGGAWTTIADIQSRARPLNKLYVYRRTGTQLFTLALEIVQYVAEIRKPDGERLDGYHDSQLESLRFGMLSPAKIYGGEEEATMAEALTLAGKELGNSDPYVTAFLQGGDPDAVAKRLVEGTHLTDPAARKALLDGGEAAVAASTDPMIMAARRVDPVSRQLTNELKDQIESVETPAQEKLARARFLVYGKNVYPDATFTLRLSYGTVKGYPMNGTIAPSKTTFYGLYDRSAGFNNKGPFVLPKRYADGVDKLDLSTPLDFVSTGDIIGGNSGSPVINRNAELVGLIFDGNIESLAGDFVYDGEKNRAVAVDSAAMIEALRKLYGADKLADELEGKSN